MFSFVPVIMQISWPSCTSEKHVIDLSDLTSRWGCSVRYTSSLSQSLPTTCPKGYTELGPRMFESSGSAQRSLKCPDVQSSYTFPAGLLSMVMMWRGPFILVTVPILGVAEYPVKA